MNNCIECIHHKGDGYFMKCLHPKNIRFKGESLVDGNFETTYIVIHCTNHRDDNWLDSIVNGTCGKRGRYWEK